jgi:hypothetical protein
MLFLYLQILLFINDAEIKSSRTSTAENTTPPWVSIHAVCDQLDQGHPFRFYQKCQQLLLICRAAGEG